MHACSGSAEQGPPDCDEKRDPRERPIGHQAIRSFDPHARLEKETLPPALKLDLDGVTDWSLAASRFSAVYAGLLLTVGSNLNPHSPSAAIN